MLILNFEFKYWICKYLMKQRFIIFKMKLDIFQQRKYGLFLYKFPNNPT